MQTATNPTTGERLTLQNGQWVPLVESAPAPVQAAAPRPRPAPVRGPQALAPVAPAPVAPQTAATNDLGISSSQEMESLVRQGYSLEEAQRFASQPEAAGPAMPEAIAAPAQTATNPETGEVLTLQNGQWVPAVSVGGPAGTQENPIDLSRPLMADEVPLLVQGAYVRAGDGTVYPLPGDAFQQQPRASDEAQAGGAYIRRPNLEDTAGNFAMAAGEQIPGLDEGATLASALMKGSDYSTERENYLQTQLLGNQTDRGARIAGGLAGFAGSLALPGTIGLKGLQGMTGVGRTAAAAAGAAPLSAAYGFASGEGSAADRAPGAVLSGLLGAGATGVLDAGIQAAPNIGQGVRNAATSLGEALNPSVEQRVGNALRQTVTRDDRMNIDELVKQLEGLTPGGLPVDVVGPNMRGVAEVLAQTPGSAQTRVTGAVNTRRADAGNRIQQAMAQEVGGEGNYFATLNGLIDTRRQAANEVIDRIGPQQFQLDENAVRSLRSDLAQPELRRAAQNALASPDQQTYEMGANLMRLADTLRDNPAAAALDVRTAQDVSRALIDMGSDAWRSGDGSRGKALTDIGRAIRNNARTAVPEYGEWLARYGDESSQVEALELGRGVFRNADDPSADGNSAEVLRERFGEMSETARELFRKGVGEALVARARTSRGGVGAMRDLVRTQEFADRVQLAFPTQDAFERFMQGAEAEVQRAGVDSAIIGNSATSRRDAARSRFGAANDGNGGGGIGLSAATVQGLTAEAGRQGLRAALNAFNRNRSLIYNPEANDLLGQAFSDREVLARLLQRQPASGSPGSTRGADGLAEALQRASPQAASDEFAFPPIATPRARQGGRQ